MSNLGWARCTERMADVLRRGAWYPIIEETPDGHVIVMVDQNRVQINRGDVRLRHTPPDHWSIVVRTGVMRPTWSGAGSSAPTTYAVCPSCAERQYMDGKPTSLECKRCHKTFPVDWAETC
jgi:uncharacterized protein YbaR (Trm112 family)